MSKSDHDRWGRLDRRRFLRRAGFGAMAASGALAFGARAGAEEQAGPQACPPEGCDYHAVVIGGGFAGVTAARELGANGYRTLIVEARTRLGGRTFTSEFEGHPVELGGFWIHWSQPFVWAEKERYGLDIVETPGAVPDRLVVFDGEKPVDLSLEDQMALVGAFDAYVADARQIVDRPYDLLYRKEAALAADELSAADRLAALDLPPVPRAALDGVLCTMAHNRPETMSYLDTLRWFGIPGYSFQPFLDAVGRYALRDGTGALIEKMVEDGRPEVRLATPVTRIEQRGSAVNVHTARGEMLTAAVAVVALPMNTLPDVAFSPALDPRLVAAARERHTGCGYKLYVRARGRVGNVQIIAPASEPINFALTYHEAADHTLLVAFGVQDGFDVNDDRAVQAALRRYLPDLEVESSMAYDWNLDPYSKGTYASYRPGWAEDYLPAFQQDMDRIYFAMGDHGEGWRGFIDGAIGAGIRAAERIRERLA